MTIHKPLKTLIKCYLASWQCHYLTADQGYHFPMIWFPKFKLISPHSIFKNKLLNVVFLKAWRKKYATIYTANVKLLFLVKQTYLQNFTNALPFLHWKWYTCCITINKVLVKCSKHQEPKEAKMRDLLQVKCQFASPSPLWFHFCHYYKIFFNFFLCTEFTRSVQKLSKSAF